MLKLNVGFSKKIGESNYGSRGASVSLELETESGLIDQPERLKERIRQLFTLAKASVDEELNGQSSTPANDSRTSNGNGHRRSTGRRSTASQIRALHAIADRQHLDIAITLQQRFGVSTPEDLSITEASTLIDELKSSANGANR